MSNIKLMAAALTILFTITTTNMQDLRGLQKDCLHSGNVWHLKQSGQYWTGTCYEWVDS